jgi:hypothetical protein
MPAMSISSCYGEIAAGDANGHGTSVSAGLRTGRSPSNWAWPSPCKVLKSLYLWMLTAAPAPIYLSSIFFECSCYRMQREERRNTICRKPMLPLSRTMTSCALRCSNFARLRHSFVRIRGGLLGPRSRRRYCVPDCRRPSAGYKWRAAKSRDFWVVTACPSPSSWHSLKTDPCTRAKGWRTWLFVKTPAGGERDSAT